MRHGDESQATLSQSVDERRESLDDDVVVQRPAVVRQDDRPPACMGRDARDVRGGTVLDVVLHVPEHDRVLHADGCHCSCAGEAAVWRPEGYGRSTRDPPYFLLAPLQLAGHWAG